MATPAEPRSPDPSRWPRAGASIAVVHGGDVVLVRRTKPPLQGVWSLPGGHIEPGETAAEAALRELGEETGVAADVLGLIDVHDVIMRDAEGRLESHYLLAVFAGRWRTGEPRAASDAGDARFMPRAGLAGLALTSRTVDFVERALAMAERSG